MNQSTFHEPTESETVIEPEPDTFGVAPMRIAIVGNQGAYGFRLCRWLRNLQQDAELILLSGADRGERDQIQSFDPNTDPDSTAWISTYAKFDERLAILGDRFDVVVTLGPSGLKVANRILNVPLVHFSMGSDLFHYPICYSPPRSSLLRNWHKIYYRLFASFEAKGRRIGALETRLGLQRANAVIADYLPALEAAKELGITSKIRVWPFPEDVVRNRERVDSALLSRLTHQYVSYDRVVMWLSRLNFTDPSSGQYKGPEQFASALSRIVSENIAHVRAIVGLHGDDVEAFRQLVKTLGIEKHVDYVPHLEYEQLITYLSLPNGIVCDSLTRKKNTTSGLTREAVGVGAPVITSVDQDLMTLAYGSPLPVYAACDADTCYVALSQLVNLPDEEFSNERRKTFSWATRYLDYRVVVPRLLVLLREVRYLATH